MAFKPYKHQADTLELSKDREYYAVLWEMGCGKTKLALDTAQHLVGQNKIDAVLVIAPNGVHRNWTEDEVPKHWDWNGARFWSASKANGKRFQEDMKHLLNAPFAFLAMTPDAVMTENGYKYLKRWIKKRSSWMIIVDESTIVKTPKAKRTQRIVALAKYASYRRILTGTPVVNSPFDIYSQMRVLDGNFWKQFGFNSFSEFQVYFGVFREGVNNQQGGRKFKQLVRYKNVEQLHDIILPHSSRVTKDEVLDLPPKLYQRRVFEMSPDQKRVYQEIDDIMTADLPSGETVSMEHEIVKWLRLHQVTSNYVPTDDGEDGKLVPISDRNPRLECLQGLLREVPHSAIIWTRFKNDAAMIFDLLKGNAVRYDGSVKSEDDRAQAIRDFQSGKVQFFVGNPQAAGMGLTLHKARTVIYYNNSFSLQDRLQSEDRAHRIGQEHPVEYIDIVAEETVDVDITKALQTKVSLASIVTGDEQKEWIR